MSCARVLCSTRRNDRPTRPTQPAPFGLSFLCSERSTRRKTLRAAALRREARSPTIQQPAALPHSLPPLPLLALCPLDPITTKAASNLRGAAFGVFILSILQAGTLPFRLDLGFIISCVIRKFQSCKQAGRSSDNRKDAITDRMVCGFNPASRREGLPT